MHCFPTCHRKERRELIAGKHFSFQWLSHQCRNLQEPAIKCPAYQNKNSREGLVSNSVWHTISYQAVGIRNQVMLTHQECLYLPEIQLREENTSLHEIFETRYDDLFSSQSYVKSN